jgi:hypothetical protein
MAACASMAGVQVLAWVVLCPSPWPASAVYDDPNFPLTADGRVHHLDVKLGEGGLRCGLGATPAVVPAPSQALAMVAHSASLSSAHFTMAAGHVATIATLPTRVHGGGVSVTVAGSLPGECVASCESLRRCPNSRASLCTCACVLVCAHVAVCVSPSCQPRAVCGRRRAREAHRGVPGRREGVRAPVLPRLRGVHGVHEQGTFVVCSPRAHVGVSERRGPPSHARPRWCVG